MSPAAKPPRRAPSPGGARAIPSAPPCTSSASPNRPHREIFAMKDRKFTRVTAFGTAGGWSGKMEHQVTLQVWGEGFALVEDVRRIVEAEPALRFALLSAQDTRTPHRKHRTRVV